MTKQVNTPTSRVRFGHVRVDVTPPVGIYHPCWGAARHDRAEGIHKPLLADLMWFGPAEGDASPMIRAQFDMINLPKEQHTALRTILSETCGVPLEKVIITYSHTHASGWFSADREQFPGGEMIAPYLQDMQVKVRQAGQQLPGAVRDAIITYATGRCNLAANRDHWDEDFGGYVCGYNPSAPADDALIVGRVTDTSGDLIAVLVNYACHATTLAYDNRLISPDYVGAMQELVEENAGAPGIFLQGASGDLGPRWGYVGDTAVADKNGRQLALAALSTLESMGPPAADFQYMGPVISGATLGPWKYVPLTQEREEAIRRFAGGTHVIDLPLKPKRSADELHAERADWLAKQREADERGDVIAARDYGARAERAMRWLGRLANIPAGDVYPYHFSVYQMGDAIWVTVGGEPYNLLQTELRRAFPNHVILVSPLAGEHAAAYLLPADRYGKGLYQEEPSSLAQGCLEKLIGAATRQIAELVQQE